MTPEQREKKNERLRQWRKKKSLDPEWKKRQSEYSTAYSARRRKENTSFREKCKANQRRYYEKVKSDPGKADFLRRRSLEKYHADKSDPERHQKRRDRYNAWVKQRKKSDPEFALRLHLRSRLSDLVKRGRFRKEKSAILLIGCSLSDLQSHIQSQFKPGMSWSNYGKTWHIDHIIPCASFDLTDPRQQAICFNYLNLRPCFAKENIRKGARISAPAQMPLGL